MSNDCKCLVLAAGRGTRIRTVTDTLGHGFPKGLLQINNKPIIDQLLSQVEGLMQQGLVESTALIANEGSFPHFKKHCGEHYPYMHTFSNLVSDHRKRRGAIGDLIFAVEELGWTDSNVLVLPSDTLATLSLTSLVKTFLTSQRNINVVHDYGSTNRIKDTLGCVELDDENVCIGFEEKPARPKSTVTSVPIYCYTPHALQLIKSYAHAAQKNNEQQLLDSPGAVLPWLITQTEVMAYFASEYYDVGKPEILTELNQDT